MTLDSVLTSLSHYLPRRSIRGGDGSLYLSRFRVCDFGRDRFRVFLHKFHRGDEDRELHNHPWAWAYSLILTDGYIEERKVGHDHLLLSWKGPGHINTIYPDTFHRVHLPGKARPWTIIISGPIVGRWGFLNTETNDFTDYADFLRKKGFESAYEPGQARFDPPRRLPMVDIEEWVHRKIEKMFKKLGEYPITSFKPEVR